MPGREEVAFQLKVMRYAESLGFWVMRIPDSRFIRAGWPDLTILGGHTALYRECKLDGESTTADQRHVGRLLWRAHLDWDVWMPKDWESQRIQRELADAMD